jgi:hypothetical protein
MSLAGKSRAFLKPGERKVALNALAPVVRNELRRLGHRYMQRERADAAFRIAELGQPS